MRSVLRADARAAASGGTARVSLELLEPRPAHARAARVPSHEPQCAALVRMYPCEHEYCTLPNFDTVHYWKIYNFTFPQIEEDMEDQFRRKSTG